MLEEWRQRRADKKATAALLKNPVVQAGRDAINSQWSNAPPIRQQHSKEFLAKIGNELMQRVLQVATAEDPVAANRIGLVEMTVIAAKCQVLVLDPPPVADPPGLRGRLGISGELRSKLPALLLVDNDLAEDLHEIPDQTADTIYNFCLIRYRQCHAAAHVHHVLRAALDDYNRNEGLDWFRPLYLAQCAISEAHCRLLLRLPSEIDPIAALEYIALADFVAAGHKWPDLAWEQHYNKKLPRLV